MLHNGSYTFPYFFWVLITIKMEFGKILVYLITNISNVFLAQCWRLGTSSRLCYNFNEMAIWRDLSIFSSWYYPFLILLYLNFQKLKLWKLEIIGYWIIGTGCYIEQGLELSTTLPTRSKDFKKILPMLISVNWPNLVG